MNSELDKELLTGYLNDLTKDIVQKMIELYTQQSNIYLDDIGGSVVQESHELWREHCHKMKGAAGSVGLKQVHAYLVSVEKSLDSFDQKAVTLSELTQLNKEGITAFNQWLNTV